MAMVLVGNHKVDCKRFLTSALRVSGQALPLIQLDCEFLVCCAVPFPEGMLPSVTWSACLVASVGKNERHPVLGDAIFP